MPRTHVPRPHPLNDVFSSRHGRRRVTHRAESLVTPAHRNDGRKTWSRGREALVPSPLVAKHNERRDGLCFSAIIMLHICH